MVDGTPYQTNVSNTPCDTPGVNGVTDRSFYDHSSVIIERHAVLFEYSYEK